MKFYSLQQVTFFALFWCPRGGEEKLLGLNVSRHPLFIGGIYCLIPVTVGVLSLRSWDSSPKPACSGRSWLTILLKAVLCAPKCCLPLAVWVSLEAEMLWKTSEYSGSPEEILPDLLLGICIYKRLWMTIIWIQHVNSWISLSFSSVFSTGQGSFWITRGSLPSLQTQNS